MEARHTQGTDWQMLRVLMLSSSGVVMGLKLSSKSLGSASKGRGSNEGEDKIGWIWLGSTSGDSASGGSKSMESPLERLEEAAFL